MARPWLRLAFIVAAIAGIVVYAVLNPEMVRRCLSFGWLNVLVLAVLYVLALGFNGWILKAGLEPPYKGIALRDAVGINAASSLAGYLTPLRLGGMGSRLFILHAKYGVDPGYAVGQFLLVTLLTIGLSSLLFVVSVWVRGGEVFARYWVPTLVMAVVAAGVAISCVLLASDYIFRHIRSVLPKILANVHEAMARPWRCQLRIVCLLVGAFVLQVAQTLWLMQAVGIPPDWLFSVLVCAVANLMLVLTLTPGNLGLKEALLGSLAFTFAINEKAFIGALLVDRFVQVMVFVLATSLYSLSVGRRDET